MKGQTYELILVDDGSSDCTWNRIAEVHRRDARVRGLRHTRNCGQSAALWTGVQASRNEVIATLDGDLQNDPADVPRMIEQLQSADFVTGVRVKRNDNWVRRVSSKIAGAARRAALKSNVADTGCALRVFKREVLEAVFPFNGLHRFLPVLVASAGFKVVEFPVSHRARAAGISKYGIGNRLWRGIFDLMAIAWFQKRRFPRVKVETLDQLPTANYQLPITNPKVQRSID